MSILNDLNTAPKPPRVTYYGCVIPNTRFGALYSDEVIEEFCSKYNLQLIMEALKRLRGNKEDYNTTFDTPRKRFLHFYLRHIVMEINNHKLQLRSLNKTSHTANIKIFRGGKSGIGMNIILERAVWEGELKQIYKKRIEERLLDLYIIKTNQSEIERCWAEFVKVSRPTI